MKKKFVFSSETCRLAEIRATAREFFLENHLTEEEAATLILAIDEACTNIIRHAYQHRCRPLRITFERRRCHLRVTLRDYGKNCAPSEIRGRALEDVRPGGVGVHIIRQVFDDVIYTPKPRGTELVLIKRVSARPEGT